VNQFVHSGGLRHLFDIFVSGILGRRGNPVWCEWRQDCLGALLRLLVLFGVDSTDADMLADQLADATTTPRKRLKWLNVRKSSGTDRLLVPILSPIMIDLMDIERVMPKLGEVFLDASSPASRETIQYKTGVFGRSQVVHFAMSLLVSWVYSAHPQAENAMFSNSELATWLRRLLLEDHDPAVRREMCTGIYRMCMGSSSNGRNGQSCIAPMLSVLLEFLEDAQLMKPQRRESVNQPQISIDEPGKEPFGPACRDYFWVLCRLVENLRMSEENDNLDIVDIDQLAQRLGCGISARPFYEKRLGGASQPDDALLGMLNLMSAVLKHNPDFKQHQEGAEFVGKLFSFLYALPSPTEKMYPKCKSTLSRSACYDLIVEMVRGSFSNYTELHRLILMQHQASAHKPYPWEYWPREEGRSECGYVGLTNLGATCYMATCVQQLYMIPAARAVVLQNDGLGPHLADNFGKHLSTLHELRKMFAYLMESERKAYNPLSFCKTYQMDHQPLNTGEQKDMAEFFIDLLSKMEEMTPDIKKIVKSLFCGTLSNNVVSLDCGHVSTTTEEFYTVRCQVAEMRNLYQSLEEVCVKDMLEGDNMYTCSQCGTKVRAEKRACFKELPEILAFNTMRYSFNMVTMMKEKVNTHFSFPFRLDMAPYMEHNLIPKKGLAEETESKQKKQKETEKVPEKSCEYELIGVTVHTGTADGGHYYAFIRDRTSVKDKWYSFNDAEVKQFDPNQIGSECFGGEMSSRTYDQVTDKFLDLSIEKTNSAYMLFYERVKRSGEREGCASSEAGPSASASSATSETTTGLSTWDDCQSPSKQLATLDLSGELVEWIWQDNRNFIQDNNIFDHTYFNFMWQMVGFLPTTLNQQQDGAADDLTLLSAKLATTFFLETFIHAKEKLNIVQWVELLTKQLDSSAPACRWFLDHMASDSHWPVTIFLRCNIATIRQMFHRLVIHVIQKLRPTECESYLLPWQPADPDNHPEPSIRTKIGLRSPITRFVRMLLHLLEAGTAKSHLKHLTELFSFLHDFAKLGDQEAEFLLSVQTITICVEFYLKTVRCGGGVGEAEIVSDDDDDDEDIIALPLGGSDMAAARTASLDKMVTLVAVLVEKSRGDDNCIHLSQADNASLTSGKSLLFLYNITSDNINIRQTCNLIFSLTRHNPSLAEHVAEMVFLGVKSPEHSIHFFRLLTLLTELSAGPAGLPCYTTLIMYRVWDLAMSSPQAALDWLSIQVTRNRFAQTWLLNSMSDWVEQYLIGHANAKVRNSAAFLLVSLVPTMHFRQTFRTSRTPPSQLRDAIAQTTDGLDIIKQILEFLLGLLKSCKQYIDMNCHGTTKLVSFFQVMTHFLLSKTEKQLLRPYFQDLWGLFHPKLSEPSVPVHQNKQALLHFWYTATLDCVDNVRLILNNPHVVKNIAFNYILADHEDTDVVNFNRIMLPTYYGLLRLCCSHSRSFCRTLAQHQNIQWAFKNISPYSTQYSVAVDELMKLMTLFVAKFPDSSEEELQEIRSFRTTTLQLYLSILDGRSSWQTLISVLRILIDSTEDKLFTVCNNGLSLIYDAFNILHLMHHEATACHVTQELLDLLTLFTDLVRTIRAQSRTTELRTILSRWKDMADMTSRLLTLCNSFSLHDLREVCLNATKEMLMLWPSEMLSILIPMFHRAHVSAADTESTLLGPYFPHRDRRGTPLPSAKSVRPPRPMLQLAVPANQLEAPHGQDPEYDIALKHYFWTYHNLVDLMVRLAVNEDAINKMLIDLSAMVGLDGVPLHFQLFPKLWLDIYGSRNIERGTLKASVALLVDSHGFLEYVDAVLLDERSSLNNQYVFQFLCVFFPKVADQVLTDQVKSLIHGMCKNLIAVADTFDLTKPSAVRHLNGDFRALLLVHSGVPDITTPELKVAVQTLKERLTEQSALLEESQPPSESKTQPSPKSKEGEEKGAEGSEEVAKRRKSVDSDTDMEASKKSDVKDNNKPKKISVGEAKKIESKRRSSEESKERSSCEESSSKRSSSEMRRGSSDGPTRRGSHSSKSHVDRLRDVYAALGLSIQLLLQELDKSLAASQEGSDDERPTEESAHTGDTEESVEEESREEVSSPAGAASGKVAEEKMETSEEKDASENVDVESEGKEESGCEEAKMEDP